MDKFVALLMYVVFLVAGFFLYGSGVVSVAVAGAWVIGAYAAAEAIAVLVWSVSLFIILILLSVQFPEIPRAVRDLWNLSRRIKG